MDIRTRYEDLEETVGSFRLVPVEAWRTNPRSTRNASTTKTFVHRPNKGDADTGVHIRLHSRVRSGPFSSKFSYKMF